MNKPLLDIQNLQVTFHGQHGPLFAVRGINLQIFPGEIIGIVGESGCGKTAAMKAILGLLPTYTSHIQGKICYRNTNLIGLKEKDLRAFRGREIGIIFQDPLTSFNPTLTIGFQIVEAMRRHDPNLSAKKAQEKTVQLLEKVGVPQADLRAKEYSHTLSGGLRQRALIAMALAPEPSLLIADEPTTALDVTLQAQIFYLLQEIQKENNLSIILITHDLSLVAGFCHRVYVMYAGEIIEAATTEELFYRPKHPYTKQLLAAIPRIDRPKDVPLFSIEGAPPNLTEPLLGCAFKERCLQKQSICAKEKPLRIGERHEVACHLFSKQNPLKSYE
jgi:oligopeptide/dipeptide ABC transporter ATP-binding protein